MVIIIFTFFVKSNTIHILQNLFNPKKGKLEYVQIVLFHMILVHYTP